MGLHARRGELRKLGVNVASKGSVAALAPPARHASSSAASGAELGLPHLPRHITPGQELGDLPAERYDDCCLCGERRSYRMFCEEI